MDSLRDERAAVARFGVDVVRKENTVRLVVRAHVSCVSVTFPPWVVRFRMCTTVKGENHMEFYRTSFSIVFEDGFWVGYAEIRHQDTFRVARCVFGAEPTGPEIAAFAIGSQYQRLAFSRPFAAQERTRRAANPKRQHREIARERKAAYGVSKARDAAKEQYLEDKQMRRKAARQRRDALRERRFAERQEKRRQKRRGH